MSDNHGKKVEGDSQIEHWIDIGNATSKPSDTDFSRGSKEQSLAPQMRRDTTDETLLHPLAAANANEAQQSRSRVKPNTLQDDAKDMLRHISSENSKMTASHSSVSSNKHFQYASTAYGVRLLSKDISNTKVELQVENLMIVTKLNDVSLYYLTRELVEWIITNFPRITVYVDEELKYNDKFAAKEICKDSKCRENRIKYWNQELVQENDVFFDLVVTLGGDGTVLFVSSLFQRHVPPILSFSLGSLGFLTNFSFENFREDLKRILDNKIKTNLRMRLDCKVYRRREVTEDPKTGKKSRIVELLSTHHILNEVTIDRGPSPFISMLELYGDDSLMTVAQADGMIIATPTGSTAYSLSAGGSLIYPTINAIAVTPICPHTLSFRPIILPESMTLKVLVPTRSRGTAWASFDGKDRTELQKGDYMTISASPYVFPTVESSSVEFVNSISRQLNWNVRKQQKSFSQFLSQKNKDKLQSAVEKETSHEPGEDTKDDSDIEEIVIGDDLSDEEEFEKMQNETIKKLGDVKFSL